MHNFEALVNGVERPTARLKIVRLTISGVASCRTLSFSPGSSIDPGFGPDHHHIASVGLQLPDDQFEQLYAGNIGRNVTCRHAEAHRPRGGERFAIAVDLELDSSAFAAR